MTSQPRRASASATLIVLFSIGARELHAQSAYKIAEGQLRIESVSAQAQPATPVVPKNTLSAVRVSVRAGDRELTAEELEESFGQGFKVQAELSGPGLPQTVTLPRPGDPQFPDPLLLGLPPLSRSGTYDLRGMRITAADGHAVLDVEPQATTLRIIEQVLITSVETRPLTRDEIRQRGILLDNQAYLGFEFTLALKLESDQVHISYPVVFDRQGLPHPPTIPIPPLPNRNVAMSPLPTIVPMLLRSPPQPGQGGGGDGGGGGDLGGARIPSLLVIPGNVGYLKQFFAAQLLVSNGAPGGSGLTVRSITATIKLPPGPDLVPGTADDPLALPPLENGPAPSTLPVRGVGLDGEPGTSDDVDVLAPSVQGQAEFLVRGDQEGFHTLDFDIAAVLDGLPTGPRNLTGTAKGGVLVRNPYFDVAFTAPSVVRKGERFKLYATLTNLGQAAANELNVTLDASRMSGAHLACPHPSCGGTVVVGTLPARDSRTVEFLLESERTGEVVASYMKFQPGLQGRVTFTLGVGERGIPLSPDTLVLPASVDALPAPVVEAAMRVLGQAWSVAQAAPGQLPGQVTLTDWKTVQKKALALAEAGMRVQLGQPVAAAVRDLAFDFYGGVPLDEGFDQLLRTTTAGRDLAFALGRDARAAALGEAFSLETVFDGLHRPRIVTDGEGNSTGYDYDREGNRTYVKEPEGQETTFAYDELGKLTLVRQPVPEQGQPAPETHYAYDRDRNRLRQTDANGHAVAMTYDKLDRLETMIQDPDGLHLLTRYDANGNLQDVFDPKGQRVHSVYDALNRLDTKAFTFAPGDPYRPWRHTTLIDYDYDYDPNGNPTEIRESVASGNDPPAVLLTSRKYDDFGRLEWERAPLPDGGTRQVSTTYWRNGARKTVTDPASQVTSYTYDGQNRLQAATTAAGSTIYTYWPDDLLKTVAYPNGLVASYGYDKADRLLSLENKKDATTVSAYAYSYDHNGNRLTQQETNGGATETTGYSYDRLNRLKTVTYPADATFPAGRVVTYGYDPAGNRTLETVRKPDGTLLAQKQGVFDNANRLRALNDLVQPAQSIAFGYDENGNQTSKQVGSTTTAYRYDVRDRMVEVEQGPSILGRFQYDFDGRRTKKIGEEGIRQYVYDQTSLLAEYDEAGNPKAKYDYGSDRLISLTRPDEGRRFFSFDGLRSVTNLTDDTGSAVASYHLDAWGNFRFPSELLASKNRFAFTGYLWDKETSLFFAKARFYDPEVGRFTSQDSYLGQIDDPPSLHRYFYANANPARYIDPTGHAPEEGNSSASRPSQAEVNAELQKDFAEARQRRLARTEGPPAGEVATEENTDDRSFLKKAWDCLTGDCSVARSQAKQRTEAALKKGMAADKPLTPDQQVHADTLVASGYRRDDAQQYARHFAAHKAALADAGGEGVGLGTQGAVEFGLGYPRPLKPWHSLR